MLPKIQCSLTGLMRNHACIFLVVQVSSAWEMAGDITLQYSNLSCLRSPKVALSRLKSP